MILVIDCNDTYDNLWLASEAVLLSFICVSFGPILPLFHGSVAVALALATEVKSKAITCKSA